MCDIGECLVMVMVMAMDHNTYLPYSLVYGVLDVDSRFLRN